MKTKHQHQLKSDAKMKPLDKFILAILIAAVLNVGLFLLISFNQN